jgi:hypothetical protein
MLSSVVVVVRVRVVVEEWSAGETIQWNPKRSKCKCRFVTVVVVMLVVVVADGSNVVA